MKLYHSFYIDLEEVLDKDDKIPIDDTGKDVSKDKDMVEDPNGSEKNICLL